MNRLRTIMWSTALLALVGCGGGDVASPSPEQEVEAAGPGPWMEAETADGGYRVRWRSLVDPIPVADVFAVEVEVEEVSRGLDGISILVDSEMPHHGHGMNLVPEIEGGPAEWTARGMLFHMPGPVSYTHLTLPTKA